MIRDSEQPSRVLAVFDFDDTLVEGDSFMPFLRAVAGGVKTTQALAEGLAKIALSKDSTTDNRTRLKAHLVQRLLTGRTPSSLASALATLRRWRRWKENVHMRLLDHHAKGHTVVIASGGLDLYLPTLLHDVPHHALLCTEIEVKDGVITGAFPQGNCVRQRKAERVADFMKKNGRFTESWGYGNAPHDLPMLELMTHRLLY